MMSEAGLSATNWSCPDQQRYRRAYKACRHCRVRKAKCEYADPSAPKPPCLRCLREGRDCMFLPSFRGGRENVDKGRHRKRLAQTAADPRPRPLQAAEAASDGTKMSAAFDKKPTYLASMSLNNPSEALDLLARASASYEGEKVTPTPFAEGGLRASHPASASDGEYSKTSSLPPPVGHAMRGYDGMYTNSADALSSFFLVQQGVVRADQVRNFIGIFFSRHHHYAPIYRMCDVPLAPSRVTELVLQEPFFAATCIVIVSRFENLHVHWAAWRSLQERISALLLGSDVSLSTIIALLLLAENVPQFEHVGMSNQYKHESRVSWNLVGLAIRLSYYLGLDQKTLVATTHEAADEQTQLERLAWTQCYMHDRIFSIRLGKAFWSRGPGLCFQSPNVMTDMADEAVKNFPSLTCGGPGAAPESEFALYMQANVELIQLMTNAHDMLYPSRDRTMALVHVGEYYRLLDGLIRSFSAFQLTWKSREWHVFPLGETVWIMYHYARLYAYAFAFHAHVRRRMQESAEQTEQADQVPSDDDTSGASTALMDESARLAKVIFPRGLMGTADGKFIRESIHAATDLLQLCVDKVYVGGALAYLPARFYSFFSYAAVFLTKIVFTGAVEGDERDGIMALVQRMIDAFRDAASTVDGQHSLVRTASQLRTFLRSLAEADGHAAASGSVNGTQPASPRGARLDPSLEACYRGEELSPGPLHEQRRNLAPYEVQGVLGQALSRLSATEAENDLDIDLDGLTAMISGDIDSEVWLAYNLGAVS